MADHERRKRRRPAKSCEQCRQRKVRCDRSSPCGPCTRARASMDCSYRNSHIISSGPSNASLPALDSDHLFHRGIPTSAQVGASHPTPISNVGTEVRDIAELSRPSLQGPGTPSQHGSSVRDLQTRLQHVEQMLSSQQMEHSSSGHDPLLDKTLRDLTSRVNSIEQHLSCNKQTAGTEGLSIQAMPPRLHEPSGKMKLLGPAHFMHTVNKFQFANSFQAKEPEPSAQELKTELVTLIKECQGLRRSVKAQQTVRLNEPVPNVRDTIPAKSICDELVDGYLRTFESIYRIIHVPSFWKEYHQFWDSPDATTSSSFLMKLALILAIGTAFHPQRGKTGPDYDVHLTQTWIYAAQWWLTGPSEKSTVYLDGLQVFCLLLIARQTSSLGPSPWLSTGSLLKMATEMGLHRNPAHFPALSIFQSEMRARLWVAILELTLQSSMDSSIPPLTYPHSDSKPPSNINDEDIAPDTKIPPAPKPPGEATDTSLQLLFHKSFPLRWEAIQAINHQTHLSYPHILTLEASLKATCREIASLTHTNTPNLHPFQTKYLTLTLHKYIFNLHLPFTHQSRQNPQYHYSRKATLTAALKIASYANSVSLSLPSLKTSTLTSSSPQTPDDLTSHLLTTHGPQKGPLSLDILSALGLELATQISEGKAQAEQDEDLSPNNNPQLSSPLRAPILKSLEHIRTQLLHIIGLGTPCLKRYIVLSAILAQVKAMEEGVDVGGVVYRALGASLKECFEVLKEGVRREDVDEVGVERSGMVEEGMSGNGGGGLTEDADLDLDLLSWLWVPDVDTMEF